MAGKDYPAFVNTATTTPYATPTWTRLCRISDLQISRSKGVNDSSFHCSPNKKAIIGYKKNSVTFKYTEKKVSATGVSDTTFEALEDSYENDTVLDCCFMNGTLTAGTTRQGYRGPMVVTKLDRASGDEDAVTYDVEMHEVEDYKPDNSMFDFGAYEVVTGS